jgi:hypothetical protein
MPQGRIAGFLARAGHTVNSQLVRPAARPEFARRGPRR